MAGNPSFADWLFGGGGLVASGFGLRWAWERFEKARKSRQERLEEREEKYVAKLEARLDALEKVVDHQGEELEKHRIALGILIAKEERIDPGSAELRMVRAILGTAYPVAPNTPRDMRDMLDKI